MTRLDVQCYFQLTHFNEVLERKCEFAGVLKKGGKSVT